MNRRAFTLIELLVVIAIIAVLIAIFLPALAGARESGRTLKCQSVLRQIQVAAHLYANENHDNVPREGTLGTTRETERRNIPWDIALRPTLDDRASPSQDVGDQFATAIYYRCPSVKLSTQPVHYVSNGFAFARPGEVDERGAINPLFRRGPTPITLVRAPSTTPYMSELADDPNDELLNVWKTLGPSDMALGQCYDIWRPRHITPASGDYRINPARHGGKNPSVARSNAAYFDAISKPSDPKSSPIPTLGTTATTPTTDLVAQLRSLFPTGGGWWVGGGWANCVCKFQLAHLALFPTLFPQAKGLVERFSLVSLFSRLPPCFPPWLSVALRVDIPFPRNSRPPATSNSPHAYTLS